MAKISKEELARGRAALAAEELVLKKKWCELEGHKWDLPQPNPLNSDSLECPLRCGRCNGTAVLTITVDRDPQ
jgi:hypothetical protein